MEAGLPKAWMPLTVGEKRSLLGFIGKSSINATIYSRKWLLGKKVVCSQHDVKLSTSTCFGKVGPRPPMEIEQSRAEFSLEFTLQADTFTSDTTWKVALYTLRCFCRSHQVLWRLHGPFVQHQEKLNWKHIRAHKSNKVTGKGKIINPLRILEPFP